MFGKRLLNECRSECVGGGYRVCFLCIYSNSVRLIVVSVEFSWWWFSEYLEDYVVRCSVYGTLLFDEEELEDFGRRFWKSVRISSRGGFFCFCFVGRWRRVRFGFTGGRVYGG